jgi:hypothetical protein
MIRCLLNISGPFFIWQLSPVISRRCCASHVGDRMSGLRKYQYASRQYVPVDSCQIQECIYLQILGLVVRVTYSRTPEITKYIIKSL